MKNYTLQNIDPEDIEDLLVEVESSFDIKFVGDELLNVTTFGQLCDHIINKIQLENSDDCTSQQAFYKLREAISSTLQIDNVKISPDTSLNDLLPRPTRSSQIIKLEQHLGFTVNILRPPHWLTGTLFILLFAAIVGSFINLLIGISLLTFSISGLWIAYNSGIELDLQTVGQLAEKITRENYLKARRNPKTFNKNEIEKILTDWFSLHLDIDKSELRREEKFV